MDSTMLSEGHATNRFGEVKFQTGQNVAELILDINPRSLSGKRLMKKSHEDKNVDYILKSIVLGTKSVENRQNYYFGTAAQLKFKGEAEEDGQEVEDEQPVREGKEDEEQEVEEGNKPFVHAQEFADIRISAYQQMCTTKISPWMMDPNGNNMLVKHNEQDSGEHDPLPVIPFREKKQCLFQAKPSLLKFLIKMHASDIKIETIRSTLQKLVVDVGGNSHSHTLVIPHIGCGGIKAADWDQVINCVDQFFISCIPPTKSIRKVAQDALFDGLDENAKVNCYKLGLSEEENIQNGQIEVLTPGNLQDALNHLVTKDGLLLHTRRDSKTGLFPPLVLPVYRCDTTNAVKIAVDYEVQLVTHDTRNKNASD